MSQEVVPVTEDESPGSGARRSIWRFLKELPVLIVLALLIALLIKAFLVQAFYIPSASMEPTLDIGDRVLVNKLSYRFGEPSRGDIIVFKDPYPDACEGPNADSTASCNVGGARRVLNWVADVFGLPTGDTRDFIKRIVGLPGETIQIADGEVYVCDEPNCRPLDSEGEPLDGRRIDFKSTAEEGPQADDDTTEPYTLGDDKYFVMGDNRGNSSDSRVFEGIDRKEIIGKAFLLIWPPGRFNTI